jgi:DMSO/TMAO reductase YedYZ molybdopterin-dependent catalytic subunit
MEIRGHLPSHPVRPAKVEQAVTATLRIDGLLARPVELTRDDLAQLPRAELEESFVCEEGWTVSNLRWVGVRLSDVLTLVQPLPTARFVRAGSGTWVVPVDLARSTATFICDELNSEPLSIEQGAPWRLVVSGGACYTSVKWLDHLELTAEAGKNDSRRLAMTRLERSASSQAS